MYKAKRNIECIQYQIGTRLYYVIGEGAFPLFVTQTSSEVKIEIKTRKEIKKFINEHSLYSAVPCR